MRLGQCLLVFREGRPFSNFLVEKVDTHETLAGIVPKAEKLVRGPFVDPPFWGHFGAQNAPIAKKVKTSLSKNSSGPRTQKKQEQQRKMEPLDP